MGGMKRWRCESLSWHYFNLSVYQQRVLPLKVNADEGWLVQSECVDAAAYRSER